MKKPLSGLKVLDFTRLYAGPFCSMQLGDLGADVVKVEMPGGDPLRHQGPPFLHKQSMSFLSANRNKRSIMLNLKQEKDLSTAHELAEKADVIVENYRPGVMDRMGLGYETLSKNNRGLIFASLSGLGPDGPYWDRGAFDIIVQAEFGYMSITGERNGAPIKQGTSIFDLVCGLYGCQGILAALQQRHYTGQGQHIHTSLMEGQISFLVDAAMDYLVTGDIRQRWGSEHSNIVPYKVFKAADGELVIAAGYENLFQAFVEVIDMRHLLEDVRYATHSSRIENRNTLYPLLDSKVAEWRCQTLLSELEAAGVPCAPVNDMAAVFDHPQVLHREMRRTLQHPERGEVPTIGAAVKYSNFDITDHWSPPPALNEHADSILRDWLEPINIPTT